MEDCIATLQALYRRSNGKGDDGEGEENSSAMHNGSGGSTKHIGNVSQSWKVLSSTAMGGCNTSMTQLKGGGGGEGGSSATTTLVSRTIEVNDDTFLKRSITRMYLGNKDPVMPPPQ